MTVLVETKEYLRRVKGADVRFVRWDHSKRKRYVIYASIDNGKWSQWGAAPEVLSENVATVEAWYNRRKGVK